MNQNFKPTDFHFAGHDTFHLRYTWLPKAADYIKNSPKDVSLSQYDKVMNELGVGQNMAKSLRHWSESSLLFQNYKNKKDSKTYHELTEIGKNLFQLDPYLEDSDTNWLLHYFIVSNHKKNSLWFYLYNIFNEQIIMKDEFLLRPPIGLKTKVQRLILVLLKEIFNAVSICMIALRWIPVKRQRVFC